MIDDFVPVIRRLAGRTVKVWAVADVHIGARECDLDGFRAFLKRIESDPDSYMVICGDILNNATRDSVSNVYLETLSPSEQVQLAVELLEPVKDKILGAVGGNHERRSLRAVDLDPLFIVFCRLGIESAYRQNFEFLRIVLEDNGSRCDYALMLLHGKTEGKRKQFDYAIEGVDAIIGAHTHMPNVSKNGKLVFTTKNRVKVQPFVSVTAPSFLKYGGYAATGLYKPSAVSCPQYLLLEYKRGNKRDESITVVW